MPNNFDILDFTPSNTELLNGQSVLVADAGEFKRITKINNETFIENLNLNDESGEGSSSGDGNDSTDTKTQTELEFSNGNIIISSEESYFQVRDDNDVIRAQLGQVTTNNFGLKVNKSSGAEIFGLYGSVANLCGWNIDESAISKVSGNDYVKLDTSSSQPRLEIAQNNVVRLKAGQLDSDKYGLKIWNASAEVLMEIADGSIAAETANIGGWDITSSSLKKGTDIVLDSTNKKISINSTTFGSDGIQIEHNSGNPRMYIGDGSNEYFKYDGTDITWKAANAELDSTGKLIVTGATIGGWNVSSNEISSSSDASHKRMFFSNTDHRVEVRNTSNEVVVSMGYLGGLAKTSGSGNWAATDYGFWIKQGDKAKIDGDVDYKDGAFLVESEGSFNIADATNTIIKLGTISSERGLFIGSDLDGTPSVKAKFTNGGFRIGAQTGSGDYISYDTTNGLVVKGSITVENTIGASDLDSTVISGGKIITGLLTADNIQAGTMDADRITAGTIDSSHIDTGSITSAVVTTASVNATTITADEINLSSATVTGTLAAARIAADSLDADKISTLDMTGKSCTFTAGTIGGWTFDDNAIYRGTEGTSGNFTSTAGDITLGAGFISAKEFYIDSSGIAVFKGTLNSDTDGAISGNSVTITNLNASNISTGTLSADRISAGSIRSNKLTAGGANLIPSPAVFTTASSLEAEGWTKASTRTELRWENDAFAGSTYRCIEVGGYQDSYGSGNQSGNLSSPLIEIDTSQTYRLKLDIAHDTGTDTDFGIQLRFYTSNGSSETASFAVNADGVQAGSASTGMTLFYVASGYITNYSSKWVTVDRMMFPASATQTLMRGGGNLDEQDSASEVGITGHSAYYTNNVKMPIDAKYVKIFIINEPESYYQNVRVANISLTAVGEGLGVITGAKIQTSSSGKRILIDGSDNSMRFYDSSNNQVCRIDDNVFTSGGNDYPGFEITSDRAFFRVSDDGANEGYLQFYNEMRAISIPPASTGAIAHFSSIMRDENINYPNSSSKVQSFYADARNNGSGDAYGMYIANGLAAKPSGGDWASASDSRVKTIGDNYTTGLTELVQLQPKYYKYNGKADGAPDDGIDYVGLIAQEAETIIPSLVRKGKSEIDSVEVDDFRMMDTSELQYAIINAVKELNTRLEALENA